MVWQQCGRRVAGWVMGIVRGVGAGGGGDVGRAVMEEVEGRRMLAGGVGVAGWEEAVPSDGAVVERHEQRLPSPARMTAGVPSAARRRAEMKVDIPDPALLAAVREALGRPEGDITRGQMLHLKQLDANHDGIESLEGLQYARNLQYLRIIDNRIRDLRPLGRLTKLQELQADRNRIIDIRPLQLMVEMRKLTLSMNRISDIRPLARLVNLRTLWMIDNRISSISALRRMSDITFLVLDKNDISDISVLAGLKRLDVLGLSHNRLTDISPLRSLESLALVDVSYNYLDLAQGSVGRSVIEGLRGPYTEVDYKPQKRRPA